MSLSKDEFQTACHTFYEQWQLCDGTRDVNDWKDVKILSSFEDVFLRITKEIHSEAGSGTDAYETGNHAEADYEEDEEALAKAPLEANGPFQRRDHLIRVDYDITYSPTYQVPVLYLTCRRLSSSNPSMATTMSLDSIFELVVPESNKSELLDVGEVGALSVADHPMTDMPAFFVHPCRTAEAMGEVLAGRKTTPEIYLQTWLGLVGKSVGLSMPLGLARTLMHRANKSGRGQE